LTGTSKSARLFLPTRYQLFVDGHKLTHRPVIGLLDFLWKIASWQLTVLSMASYAFAASALQIAAISAGAFSQVDLQVGAFAHLHQQP
jgi:heme/copper-type cytochrome/quinol oxidase subunit 4